jgi:transposase
MQVLYPCCCGLDIHKKFVVACRLITTPDGHVQKEGQTFSTMTQDLLALLDWLHAAGCTHVALESTEGRTGGLSTICWRGSSRSSWAMPTT